MIRRHWQREPIEKTDEWVHRDGDFVKCADGVRYQIEYQCRVSYLLKQGRRATWAYDGGTPEEPPEIWIQAVELLDVVVYAPPSYQTGVGLDHVRDPNWKSFAMEIRNWLKGEIVKAGEFESAVLEGKFNAD
jgi:hypothetical protein